MSHEHFLSFVDMLLARPVHLDEMGGAIEGSVAEVRRLQDVNAEMLDALRSLMIAYGASDGRNGNSGECWDKARAAVAKAEGRS